MATASVGERDQISHTCGRHTMKLYCERKTSAQDLYAKGLFLGRTHLWVSFLPTSKNDGKNFGYIKIMLCIFRYIFTELP